MSSLDEAVLYIILTDYGMRNDARRVERCGEIIHFYGPNKSVGLVGQLLTRRMLSRKRDGGGQSRALYNAPRKRQCTPRRIDGVLCSRMSPPVRTHGAAPEVHLIAVLARQLPDDDTAGVGEVDDVPCRAFPRVSSAL